MSSSVSAAVIRFPHEEGEVEIQVSELPSNAAETVELLWSLQAPFSAWFEVALSYHRTGKTDQFEVIIKEMFAKRK